MLIPVNGYVVLKPYKENTRKSGLIIADTSKERPMRGTIVAAASKEWGEGVEVLYSKFGAIEIRYEDTDYIVVRERDIIAAIDDAV